MQIIIDSDEEGKIILDNVPDARITYSTELEALTGADFAISESPVPFSETTLPIHARGKLVLVQVKRGLDFPSSIQSTRLKESLVRMKRWVPHPFQRILLFVGEDHPGRYGQAVIDGEDVPVYGTHERDQRQWVSWDTVEYGKLAWGARGGTFHQISTSAEMGKFAEIIIKIMTKDDDGIFFPPTTGKAELIPEGSELLPLHLVPDAWVVIAAHRGIGPKAVQALAEKWGGNYAGMLEELTNPWLQSDVHGIGKGTITNVRNLWGLHPWEGLGRVVYPGLAEDAGVEYWDAMRCATCPLLEQPPLRMGNYYVPCDQMTKKCKRR